MTSTRLYGLLVVVVVVAAGVVFAGAWSGSLVDVVAVTGCVVFPSGP